MSSHIPVKLYYEVVVPVEKRKLADIILIHGMTQSTQTWLNIAKKLADESHRTVYMVDVRNHGDSPRSDVFNYEVMAEDITHFMDERGISSAILLGHSMGGKIAMMTALTKPEMVERLIVEDMGVTKFSDEMNKFPQLAMTMFLKCLEVIPSEVDLPTAQKIAMGFLYKNTPEEARNNAAHREDGSHLELIKKDGKYVWKTNFEVLLKAFEHPEMNTSLKGVYTNSALFVYGTQSQLNVYGDKDNILKRFPNAKIRGIEGATHLVHTEYPEKFCRVVLEFLKDS